MNYHVVEVHRGKRLDEEFLNNMAMAAMMTDIDKKLAERWLERTPHTGAPTDGKASTWMMFAMLIEQART